MDTFFHPEQLLHHPRTYLSRGQMRIPQEIPDRAVRMVQAVRTLGYPIIQPHDSGMLPLLDVHGISYLRFLEGAHRRWKLLPSDWGDEVISNIYVREPNALRGVLAEAARYLADGSCPVGESTWRSAYWSAQSAVAAAHALLEGKGAAYALCRPPGHHARAEAAGGFCYLNNAAIAAQVLHQKYKRIVVLDTDMHHGQGIQEIFYDRDDMFYISIHGDPTNFYPAVTGFDDERGSGKGVGYNLNLPMPHGSAEHVFFERLQESIAAIRGFEPEALVLALGFDIYKEDPQAQVAVSTEGFHRLASVVRQLNLPTLVVQEGGYHLETLEINLASFFNGMNGQA
ncbi:acetylpolyamine amidohydrolase [Pollutimonas nitritireducens]|uniref:Acetylpolyamine amidohydrolase n=1 Tax=Pollutimonas nitritireducens TaxID=2045209 RepID=A0A2N4UKE4_9BURK|nr:histone deacetylase family protein [Pollutimonas nitritireducens]PLC55458.1 acetylpolyamine amidohydrolase [Pollutimonas nitritireducens]